jgi:hypothetical protein
LNKKVINFLINHLHLAVYIGAVFGYIINFEKYSDKRSISFLKELFPNWKEENYSRIDAVITPMIGAIMAYVLITPLDLQAAIVSGFSCHLALTSVDKKLKR